ncbi:MAG: thioredoxin family protein [Acidimicrobiaceae bacterium]|nr:thioredoxin family protein [Acidimicrobiaceae bacterium]
MVIAVAIDENIEAIKELANGITYPVLMDKDHILTELYAISNVPSVIWIDEKGMISRPAASEFGTDTFAEITGISRETHMQQVRDWVHDGALPEDASYVVPDLSEEEIQARLHFRIAVHLRREDQLGEADIHFDKAAELAPLDFTIVRASMPLRGGDPFGEEFFTLYQKYQDAGSPFHGIPRGAS